MNKTDRNEGKGRANGTRRIAAIAAIVVAILSATVHARPARLAWDPNPQNGVQGYRIYRAETSGGPYSRLNSTPVSATRYSDETALPGHTYYYVLTAIGSDGAESGFSAERQISLPTYDTMVSRALPDIVANPGQMVIISSNTWNPDGRATSFNWTQVLGPTVHIVVTGGPEAAFIAPPVTQDTVFVFVLTAADASERRGSDTIRVLVLK
jgi:hypothetical protein